MPRMQHFLPLLPAALLALVPSPSPAAAQIQVKSDTFLRLFQQERASGDEKQGAPGYEYLQLDFGELQSEGLSLHAYGWGRYDFGDYYRDHSEGEILYGYLQYSNATNDFSARLGRQSVFDGVSNESIDGLRVGVDVTPFFAVSAYGGQPVSLEEVNGRSGDRIWGGRLSHHLWNYYELGVSYKRIDNDGDKEVETLGIDSSVTPPGPISLYGRSSRNLVTQEWAEHSYEARASIGALVVKPFFQRFDYGAYFDKGLDTGGVFRFLEKSNERITVWGGEASWQGLKKLELSAKAKHYGYKERDEDAWYGSGLAAYRATDLTQVGGEVGVMNGDSAENKYSLWRAYAYWDGSPIFVSADYVYVHYNEEIHGVDRSLFASLGAGAKFLSDKLRVMLSGDYSMDPYFDSNFRGMFAVKYAFDSK